MLVKWEFEKTRLACPASGMSNSWKTFQGSSGWLRRYGICPFLVSPSNHSTAAKKGSYWAVSPPSITNSDPVTKDDSSDAKYRMPHAISLAEPVRPIGVRDSTHRSLSASWNPRLVMGVSAKPGCTELTRMFSLVY